MTLSPRDETPLDHRRATQCGALALSLALLIVMTLASPPGKAAEPTFAERLGWRSDQVVVILHIDDVGMSHASNLGAMQGLDPGVATSFAVMMPCSWVPEIARYVKANPTVDCGLHLTLTSEWKSYRWGPLAGRSAVPGLVDDEGCLWPSVIQVATRATPDEIEREIRAQLERAERLGMTVTHLDSHMGTLFAREDYFERYAKLGIEKRIPILAVGGHLTHATRENGEAVAKLRPWIKRIWNAGLPVLDDLHTSFTGSGVNGKPERLAALLGELKPGVTEILFHASVMTEELPLITGSSEARRADLEALKHPTVRAALERQGIVRTTWRELMERRQKAAPMPD